MKLPTTSILVCLANISKVFGRLSDNDSETVCVKFALSDKELIKLISKPFYVYTTKSFFESGNMLRSFSINNVIKYTDDYVNQNHTFSKPTSEAKDPSEILLHLCNNIEEGINFLGLGKLLNPKDKIALQILIQGCVTNPSYLFLEKYLAYYPTYIKHLEEQQEKDKVPFEPKRVSLFTAIVRFILRLLGFGNKKEDSDVKSTVDTEDDRLEIKNIKQICESKRDKQSEFVGKNKYENDSDIISMNAADAIGMVGRILLGVEIRQAIIPKHQKVYKKIKYELGMLLSVIKLMNYDDLKSSPKFSGYLNLEADVIYYMNEFKSEFEALRENPEIDKNESMIEFIKYNKYELDKIIQKWISNGTDKPDTKNETTLVEEYVDYLHRALMVFEENTMNHHY